LEPCSEFVSVRFFYEDHDLYLLYRKFGTYDLGNCIVWICRLKLELAIGQFPGEPSALESSVFERFDLFRAAPFTIQRLSELITEPNRHYKMKEKYMFALEKTVYVVSTVDPLPTDHVNNNGEDAEEAGEEHDSSAEFSDDNNGLNSSFIHHGSWSPRPSGTKLSLFSKKIC